MDRRSLLKVLGLSPLVSLPSVAEAKLPELTITTALSSKTKVVRVRDGQIVLFSVVVIPKSLGRVELSRDGKAVHSLPVNSVQHSVGGRVEASVLATSFSSFDRPGPGAHEYTLTCTGGGEVEFTADILDW